MKFPLSSDAVAAIKKTKPAALVFDHPNWKAKFDLPLSTVAALAEDLA